MDRIGLLGGTFNPPHNGHLYLAHSLLREFSLEEIIFIPTGIPPHKRDQKILSNEHRLALLKLMCAGDPRLSVNDLEMRREGYTYTVDTLNELTAQMPNTEFFYIIGTDTLFQLKKWKECEEVFRLTSFLCVPRPGDPESEISAELTALKNTYSARICLSRGCGPDISSTQIRTAAKNRESLRGLVPEKLEEYIVQNGLFRD